MKVKEIRVGNMLTRKSSPDTICYVNWGMIKEFELGESHEYIPIPITEERLLRLGCVKYNGVLPSYEIKIQTPQTFGYYKALSLSYNNDNSTNQYYCWFREGDADADRSKDSVVCLRKDLKYIHQFQNLVLDISGNELTMR